MRLFCQKTRMIKMHIKNFTIKNFETAISIKSAGAGVSIAKMETNCHVCDVAMKIPAVTITDEGEYRPICESCKGKLKPYGSKRGCYVLPDTTLKRGNDA